MLKLYPQDGVNVTRMKTKVTNVIFSALFSNSPHDKQG